MHLNSVSFETGDGGECVMAEPSELSLSVAANLFGLEYNKLKKGLTTRQLTMNDADIV